MSKALRIRLLEHAGALALVLAIVGLIGWCLAESHQGVLEATGEAPPAVAARLHRPMHGSAALVAAPARIGTVAARHAGRPDETR